MLQLSNLASLTHPAVAHVHFGWFNLTWPNIAFWIAVIVLFAVCAWARIPPGMEAGADSRRHAGQSLGPREKHS